MKSEPKITSPHLTSNPETAQRPGKSRRRFLGSLLAAGAAANLPLADDPLSGDILPLDGLEETPTPAALADSSAKPGCADSTGNAAARRANAYQIRLQAALAEMQQPLPDHPNNGDECRYPNKVANSCKGLPQND